MNRLIHISHVVSRLGQHKFSKSQYGSLSGKGTIELLYDLKEFLFVGNEFVIVKIDVNRAFESIKHNILVQILEGWNFPPYFLSSIVDSLNNRTVSTGRNKNKKTKFVTTGTPQGTTYAPFIFTLYLNQVLLSVEEYITVNTNQMQNASLKLFAICDDLILAVRKNEAMGNEELAMKINDIMVNVAEICSEYSLSINKNKTEIGALLNGEFIHTFNEKIGIIPKRQIKVLGLTFCNKHFEKHIGKIQVKVQDVISNFREAFPYYPFHKRKMISLKYVTGKITYACQVYYPHILEKDIAIIDSLQKMLLEYVVKSSHSPIYPLLVLCKQIPMSLQCKKAYMVFLAYKGKMHVEGTLPTQNINIIYSMHPATWSTIPHIEHDEVVHDLGSENHIAVYIDGSIRGKLSSSAVIAYHFFRTGPNEPTSNS